MRSYPFDPDGPAYSRDPLELTGGMPPPDRGDRFTRFEPAGPWQPDTHQPDAYPAGSYSSILPVVQRPRRLLRWVGRGLAIFVFLFVLAVGWLAVTAPLSKSLQPPTPPSITLLADDGSPIARHGAIIGKPVDAAKLPKHVGTAFLANEDRGCRPGAAVGRARSPPAARRHLFRRLGAARRARPCRRDRHRDDGADHARQAPAALRRARDGARRRASGADRAGRDAARRPRRGDGRRQELCRQRVQPRHPGAEPAWLAVQAVRLSRRIAQRHAARFYGRRQTGDDRRLEPEERRWPLSRPDHAAPGLRALVQRGGGAPHPEGRRRELPGQRARAGGGAQPQLV